MSESYEDIIDVIVAIQEGDFDVVCEAIRNKLVSVNCTDKDGCSLLHWAAINNRVEIANFLFDNGLNFAGGGGILFESPLQWAIRKKHYAMADIIFQKCHCDLSHKSKQGDINATFLVLNWGANPNSVDGGGDTPLLWLLKNRSGQATLEIIRLLLKFGADVQFQNPNDGNTAMHLLAQTRGADYSLAFQIYQAGGGGVSSIENKSGLTPYTQAVNSENRLLARFLYDQLVFNFTPYWTPILFSAAVACLFFLLVSFLGFFYGLLYWGLAYMAISWVLLQWQVVDHRGRIDMGYTMGLFASLVVSFYVFVGDFMSLFMKLLCLAAVTGLVYVAYAFHSKKPLTSKADSRQAISALIVHSSPSEGPDAEADLRSLDNAGAPATEKASPSSPKRSVFVKDQFTGALQRVSVDDLDKKTAGVSGKNPVRKRTIGPRLCGTCLADKRAIVQCTPSSGASTKRGPGEPETVISMATHCNTCDMCVVDLDHHSTYLGNCVGKGNRRLYCLFLLMGGLCSFLYFIAAKWTHYHIYCAQYKGSVLSQVIGVEWCMLTSKPAFGLLSWISLYALAFFLLTLRMQVSMVARETTLINVMKRRYEMKPPTIKRANKNMMQFFFHGTYNVTYPKKGANPPAPCCSKHGKCSDKAGSGGEALKNTAEYDKALRMLSGIDSKLQAMEEGRTGLSNSHIPAADSRAAPITGSDRMNRSAAVSEVKTEPPRSAPQQPQGHSHGQGQNVSDDTDDNYDEEWADSAHNNYHRHYFNDEDEELEQGGGDQEQEDEFALDSTQEEAESAALLARNRVRTDSLQLFKENLNVKTNTAAMGNSKNGNFMRISSTERM